MLRRQIEIARQEGLSRVQAVLLPEADAMRHLVEKLGFSVRDLPDSKQMLAELTL
jgi:hypothetical protein